MNNVPKYYKTSLTDIENTVKSVKKAAVKTLCFSAGGRQVYMFRYGDENVLIARLIYLLPWAEKTSAALPIKPQQIMCLRFCLWDVFTAANLRVQRHCLIS